MYQELCQDQTYAPRVWGCRACWERDFLSSKVSEKSPVSKPSWYPQSFFCNKAVTHQATEKYNTHPTEEQSSGSIEAFADTVLKLRKLLIFQI